MKASARAILVTDKPWGVDFGNVADIFSPADDLGYLHEVQNSHIHTHRWIDASLLCVAPGSPLSRISKMTNLGNHCAHVYAVFSPPTLL